MSTTTLRCSIRDAAAPIAARQPFKAYGSLSGVQAQDAFSTGSLPEPYRSQFFATAGDILYVVYSYFTPIAWFSDSKGWVVPDVKYSVTTSRHQGVVRRAVA